MAPVSEQAMVGDRRLKIGILSFAHGHAAGYAAALAGLGVELGGADVDRGRLEVMAERVGLTVFRDYEELLAWQPDGVVVASENVRHCELTLQAAEAGAYVLSEKPLATSLADCRRMIEACERAGVGLMTAFPIRFVPAVSQLAAAVHAGRLGALKAIAGRNPGSMPGGWFCQPELSGGGSVMDHTVHVGDLMGWFTGAEPVTVYAQTNAIIRPDAGVETGGLLAVRFSDGTIATIDASWSRLPSYPTWGGVSLEVVGTEGVVQVDAFARYLELFATPARRLSYGANADQLMLEEFLASIRERRAPSPDGQAGMRATAIALAAYRSAERGTVVKVFDEA